MNAAQRRDVARTILALRAEERLAMVQLIAGEQSGRRTSHRTRVLRTHLPARLDNPIQYVRRVILPARRELNGR